MRWARRVAGGVEDVEGEVKGSGSGVEFFIGVVRRRWLVNAKLK